MPKNWQASIYAEKENIQMIRCICTMYIKCKYNLQMNQIDESRERCAKEPAFIIFNLQKVYNMLVCSHGCVSSVEWQRVKMQTL